ncbi:MAG TPA: hypothetical protein ENH85_09930 [Candidatus Scalindua sp.]|nr:hypothetical protein [Candidatus Scalindua sp.]
MYEEDLHIDENALDLEWLLQPRLMLQYIDEQASARRQVDREKEKLAVVRAELDKKIRSDPEFFKLEKITESLISSTIIVQKKYKKAMKTVIDSQYEYQMAQGAVQSVEQRKSALENLVKLFGMGYFSGPKTPRDISSEVLKDQKKKRSNSNVKIKRKNNE